MTTAIDPHPTSPRHDVATITIDAELGVGQIAVRSTR